LLGAFHVEDYWWAGVPMKEEWRRRRRQKQRSKVTPLEWGEGSEGFGGARKRSQDPLLLHHSGRWLYQCALAQHS